MRFEIQDLSPSVWRKKSAKTLLIPNDTDETIPLADMFTSCPADPGPPSN